MKVPAGCIALALIFLAAAPAPRHRYLVSWAMESKDFPGDGVGRDFLAVFDIGEAENFGRLAAMLPVESHALMAHHTNETMPANHLLFANDFEAGRTYVFDVRDPLRPRAAGSFGDAGPYTHPHSFATLSDGNVLATYQIKGWSGNAAGALVLLDERGRVLRTSDASAPAIDPNIRPYGLLALENLDRVVTTSAPMPPLRTSEPSRVVQVWRLSDLKLLKTVVLPKPSFSKGAAADDSDDAALLSDGKTILVKTGACGLYRLDGVEGTDPVATFVYDFGYRGCSGVPAVVGNYWIETSTSGHSVTSLNVSDPSHPVEAGHLLLDAGATPHWLAAEPGTGLLAITGFGSMLHRIAFASVDPQTGALARSERTIDFDRTLWPDGWRGPAIPHATLFY
jgi:hypothetical protein